MLNGVDKDIVDATIAEVPKFPTLALPVAFNVPVTLTPVHVTIAILALPTAEIVTFQLAAEIFKL